MLSLIINGQTDKALEITNFDRNTSFYEDGITSIAYGQVVNAGNAVEALQEIGLDKVTSLQINNSEEQPIYLLENQNARLTTINESLSEEQIHISFNIDFNLVKNNQEPTE